MAKKGARPKTKTETNELGILDSVNAMKVFSNGMKTSFAKANAAASQALVSKIDWKKIDVDFPELLDEEGFFVGEKFKPEDAEEVEKGIEQFQKWYSGQGALPGNWGEKLEKLSRAL